MIDWSVPFALWLCGRRDKEEVVRYEKTEYTPSHATLVPVTVVPWEEFVKSAEKKDL